MKAKTRTFLVISMIITMMVAGCSPNTSTDSHSAELKSQMESMQKELDDLKEEINLLKEQIETSPANAFKDIITDLESDDYDGAREKIDQMQKDEMAEKAGDINDYLVSVELTADNFDEYFEFVREPQYNAFGEEQKDAYSYGLRSKKYDEGLVIYSVDDIIIEYSIKYEYGEETTQNYLDNLLCLGRGDINPNGLKFIRSTEGEIVFIKNDYIQSYDVEEEPFDYHGLRDVTIILRNGEELYRSVFKEYLY